MKNSQTINDIIKDIVRKPLGITNSIQLSKDIIDILTDGDCYNDKIAYDLLGEIKGKLMNSLREIINC
jgi:hypothetical protein